MTPFDELPDPSCHRTGWTARKIAGRWCVGMTGNLDTVHDAVVIINNHYGDDVEAKKTAEWIAEQYNQLRAKLRGE